MRKRYIIIFKEEADAELVESSGGVVVDELTALTDMMIVDLTEEERTELEKDESVDLIEEDQESDPCGVIKEAELSYGETYAIDNLNVKDFWERGYKGQGIKVAIMDTGSVDHKGLDISGGVNGYGSGSYLRDVSGHGTHVAGIVAGQPIKGGYVGIAPEAELYII